MNILAQGVMNNTYSGFRLAAKEAGHKWIWWEENHTPAFDVFDEVRPDLVFYMGASRALEKCLQQFQVPSVQGDEHNPFTFVVEGDMVLECDRLVDDLMFYKDKPDPAYESELVIAAAEFPMGFHLCNMLGSLKIIHETPWPVSQYMGVASLEQKKLFYNSTPLVLTDNLSEAMRAILCGALVVVTNVKHVIALSKDGGPPEELMPCITDVGDFLDFYHNMVVANPQEGEKIHQELVKCTRGHTYTDALSVILEAVE